MSTSKAAAGALDVSAVVTDENNPRFLHAAADYAGRVVISAQNAVRGAEVKVEKYRELLAAAKSDLAEAKRELKVAEQADEDARAKVD